MSIVSDPGILWSCFILLCDWSKTKLTPPSQLSKCKTRTNSILVTRGFPRFKQVASFYLKFSLANDDVNLCYDW